MDSEKYRVDMRWTIIQPPTRRLLSYTVEEKAYPKITSTTITLLFCAISFGFGLFVAGIQ